MEKAKLEADRWSALHHVVQLLIGRSPEDVAWWLRANYPEFVENELASHVRARVDALANDAETKPQN